jgi:putative flippase GtrA
MVALVRRVWCVAHTPSGVKFVRYVVASGIATVVSLGLLYLFYRVLPVGSAVLANILATALATIPSYFLNRNWAWGKSGRSKVWREVVPFWVIAFLSLVISTVAVGVVADELRGTSASHLVVTIAVEATNFTTYLLLWLGKFAVFNRLLFADAPGPRLRVEEPVRSAPASTIEPLDVPSGITVASVRFPPPAPVAAAPSTAGPPGSRERRAPG